jgi:hypothetical protein
MIIKLWVIVVLDYNRIDGTPTVEMSIMYYRINELSMAARSLEEPFREDEDFFLNCFENEPSLIRCCRSSRIQFFLNGLFKRDKATRDFFTVFLFQIMVYTANSFGLMYSLKRISPTHSQIPFISHS